VHKEKRMNKKLVAAGLALLGAVYSIGALAQTPSDNMVRQRQGVMLLQGKYFGPLGAMAAGKVPYNAEVVARNAGYLNALGQMPWDAFTPETANATVKTRALPEIYKDSAGFKKAAERLQGGVSKLAAEAKNEAGAKAADQYRSK
jgi:cytochrome c556